LIIVNIVNEKGIDNHETGEDSEEDDEKTTGWRDT